MELRQLEYVTAVAELGSFTRAAERCFVVQSALSHQIARLEQELGTRLFHRTSRQVRLTAAGEAFLAPARQCLDAAERARAEVAAATGEVRGRLTVGVIQTVASVDLATVLRRYRRKHPQVRVRLTTGITDTLVQQVVDGRCDVALLGLPSGTLLDAVHDHVLVEDRQVAVLARDHRLAARSRLRLAQLAGEVFVDFPPGSPGRAQTDDAFAAAGLGRDVGYEVVDAHLMARLIRQRLGIGLLASTFAPQLPGVATVPVVDGPRRAEHVVWSRHGPSPAAAAFLGLLDVPTKVDA